MSNYTPIVDFAAKDGLTPGDPDKKARGTELSAELDAIATAITSKEDTANKGQANGYAGLDASGLIVPADLPDATDTTDGVVELATDAEAVTGTATNKVLTPANLEAWAAQNAGLVKDLSDYADPGADIIFFWDESANALASLTLSGLTITGTALAVDAATEGAAGVVELATTAEAVTGTDTTRAITAAGLEAWAAQNGGYVQDLSNLTDPGADRILFWDDSAGAITHLTVSTGLTISTTSLTIASNVVVEDGANTFSVRPTFTSQGGFLNNASSSNTGGDVTLSSSVPATAGDVGAAGDWRLVY